MARSEVLADESFECGLEDAPAPDIAPETALLRALTAATAAREQLTKTIQPRIARVRSRSASIEITGFRKKGGPLTKRIRLTDDGELLGDGSACVMSEGIAWRATFDGLPEFADFISDLRPNEAIALGALLTGLPDTVQVVTKPRLPKVRSAGKRNVIARIREFLDFRPGHPALALIDIDVKTMPPEVRDRIKASGGLLRALMSILPELATVGSVIRRSTSAGIRRVDTGNTVTRAGGLHIYILVLDGADIERFLRTLHDRCWLHGLGWKILGATGQLLDRSLIDQSVYAGERLVFEASPELAGPLVQDQERCRPRAIEGPPLDTVAACPPLRIAEDAKLKELRAKETHRLAPQRMQMRKDHAALLAEQTGVTMETALRTIELQIAGILLPNFVLPFDGEEFRGCTVGDVLRDPARFEGATSADPLEGVAYGRCKAKIMRRADGSIWIHSFAHGRSTYELKFDAAAIEAILKDTPDVDLVNLFVNLVLDADIQDHERERVRNDVSTRTGTNKRTIDKAIEKAVNEREMSRAQEARERGLAERRDPRPLVPVPAGDAPWLPQMDALNDILGASTAAEPPARDIDGYVTQVRTRRPANMHTLTAAEANGEGTGDTLLPPPEHPLLTRLDHAAVAELIEQYVDYVDSKGRSVHLPAHFVSHFVHRTDHALPIMNAVATLPIVIPDGTILSETGLHRDRGIVFRVSPKLRSLLPRVADCTPGAVAEAMDFLVNGWMCDVATDYAGKCLLIAIVASIIERTELPERPAFFISAGQRGGGKTTVVHMISVAVLGTRAAAATFLPSEEERRKALLAYFSEGVALGHKLTKGVPPGIEM
ncbi:MAG: hypothetical protein WA459_23845 [Stellaceae bacterium]